MIEFAKRLCIYSAIAALVCWWMFDSWLIGILVGAVLAVAELVFLGTLFRGSKRD